MKYIVFGEFENIQQVANGAYICLNRIKENKLLWFIIPKHIKNNINDIIEAIVEFGCD